MSSNHLFSSLKAHCSLNLLKSMIHELGKPVPKQDYVSNDDELYSLVLKM